MIELLQESINIHNKLLEIEDKIETLDKFNISKSNYSNTKVSPTNKHSSSIEDILIKREELQSQWVKASCDELKIHMEIEKQLDTVLDPIERLIIRLRYTSYLSWKEISNKTGYSTRQLQRIHKSVLDIKEADK